MNLRFATDRGPRIACILVALALVSACGARGPSTIPVASPDAQAATHLTAAQAALAQEDLATAEREYRAAVEADPQSAKARAGLGTVLVRAGKLQDAESAFLASLKLNPKQADVHANLGVVYYQQGEMPAAAASFEEALRQNANDAATLYLLAAVRLQQKDLAAAESLLKKAQSLDPRLPEVYYGLGVLYRLQGQPQDAIAAFEKFIEIGPGQDPSAADHARRELEALRAE